jgi:hypothetical protein
VGPARPWAFLQAAESLVVEPADPGVDGGPRAALAGDDGGGLLPPGGGQDDPGALDESGRCGPGAGQGIEGGVLLGGECAERNSGSHG